MGAEHEIEEAGDGKEERVETVAEAGWRRRGWEAEGWRELRGASAMAMKVEVVNFYRHETPLAWYVPEKRPAAQTQRRSL